MAGGRDDLAAKMIANVEQGQLIPEYQPTAKEAEREEGKRKYERLREKEGQMECERWRQNEGIKGRK